MPTISHIRGMLLEEVLLHLLRGTGYRTVESAGTDPTLNDGHAGMEVRGRGSVHQIDAIADFKIRHPFSNPHRLLVEAKCYEKTSIGIEVARNAVGVLKDISEFWVATERPHNTGNSVMDSRYHYQYALFSVTPYSRNTQQYAFAQDVYLISLGNSRFFKPIVNAIRAVDTNDFDRSNGNSLRVELKDLRERLRNRLKNETLSEALPFPNYGSSLQSKLLTLIREAERINYALLAVFEGGFPVFLVPANDLSVQTLPNMVHTRIRWNDDGWYIYDNDDRQLFSFDLPQRFFDLYASRGRLRPERALQMKEDLMRSFYAFLTTGESVRVIAFELNLEWIDAIRQARPRLRG